METNVPENIKSKGRGRPISAKWRFDKDGNLVKPKVEDKEYIYHYYHEKLNCQTDCPKCGRIVVLQKLARHQKSKICKTIQAGLIATETESESEKQDF